MKSCEVLSDHNPSPPPHLSLTLDNQICTQWMLAERFCGHKEQAKLAQKSFASPGKKMLYFKNGRNKNNSVCLAICVGVLALIWYLICEIWMWNNRVLDIWLTLGHIRKVAVVKSHTRPRFLSCWCYPGSSSTRMVFYLSSRTESIPICILFRDQS